jgi:hypothetical protein
MNAKQSNEAALEQAIRDEGYDIATDPETGEINLTRTPTHEGGYAFEIVKILKAAAEQGYQKEEVLAMAAGCTDYDLEEVFDQACSFRATFEEHGATPMNRR